MAERLTKYGYALVAIFKDGEDIVLSTARPRRKDVIRHAEDTFYDGRHSWSEIKRRGWRVQKIKITAVRP